MLFRLCGQPSIGPSGVDAQSCARMRPAISPDNPGQYLDPLSATMDKSAFGSGKPRFRFFPIRTAFA